MNKYSLFTNVEQIYHAMRIRIEVERIDATRILKNLKEEERRQLKNQMRSCYDGDDYSEAIDEETVDSDDSHERAHIEILKEDLRKVGRTGELIPLDDRFTRSTHTHQGENHM